MGSVIPGKVDPNYQGDLRYAEPIKGTAFAITDKNVVKPISTPSQPFQEQYYRPGWTYNNPQTGASQPDPSSQVNTVLVSGGSYQQLQQERAAAAAAERERTAFFGIPAKVKEYNKKGSDIIMGLGAKAYGTTPERFTTAYETARDIHLASPLMTPGTPKAVSNYGIGFVSGAVEKPVTTAASAAVGYGIGAAFRAAPAALEFSGVTKLISGSQPATRIAAGAGRVVPAALTAIYAGEVALSTYQQPAGSRAYYLGQRSSTEIIPITAGGLVGFKNVDKLIGGTRYSLTDRVTAYNQIYNLPKEQQPAARATYESYLKVYGYKTPLQGATPDFTGIKNLGRQGPKVGAIIAEEPHTFFGSSSWSWQRPKEWVSFRGQPSDLDAFVGAPSKTAGRIVKGTSGFTLDTSHSGLVVNAKVPKQPHAVDLHTPPENYPGIRAMEAETGSDIVKSVLQAAPKSRKGIVTTPTGTYEKDWVQTQRKLASVFGEKGKYGPPGRIGTKESPRMKDAMDSILDLSYYGQQGYDLKPEFTTLKKYWTNPKVYSQYKGGEEYAKAISQVEYGRTPGGRAPSSKTPELISPSTARSGSMSAMTALITPSLASRESSPSVMKSGGFTSVKPSSSTIIKSLTSPTPSPSRTPSVTPSITPSIRHTPTPSVTPSRTPSFIPSVTPTPSPSPSPGTYPYPSRSPSPYVYTPPKPSVITPPYPGYASLGGSGRGGGGYGWFTRAKWKNPVPTVASFFGPLVVNKTKKEKKKKTRRFPFL